MHCGRLIPWRQLAAAFVLAVAIGCQAIPPQLPNAVPGLTLDTVSQVQNDPTLTPADRMNIIRSLLGVEDDDAGNRLVSFVLSVQVPPRRQPGT